MKGKIMNCLLWAIIMVMFSFSWIYGNAGPIIVEEDPVFIKTLSDPYILLLIIPVVLVLAVLGLVAIVVMMALKKYGMNLKE